MNTDSPEEKRGARILVVEDEESILRGLCDVLAFHGHAPDAVANGEDGLRQALAEEYALVLLDVMLPGLSGFDVCRELRSQRPRLPILMLTARGSEEDVLEGFRCGSDDYLTKPFSVAELVARIEALLRRAGSLPVEQAAAFEFGPWTVEPAQARAERDGETVELTKRELDMLGLFHRERGRIVSRRALLSEVWGMNAADRVETRTVDMHIAKLRKKIGAGDASPIETVRGEGYRFAG
ncbi:MAG: response regulator transcription factor [Deltaproteobacteria bacterium]|nr:response regulator transcription factor [Deltaproteobacteria bacterium]